MKHYDRAVGLALGLSLGVCYGITAYAVVRMFGLVP